MREVEFHFLKDEGDPSSSTVEVQCSKSNSCLDAPFTAVLRLRGAFPDKGVEALICVLRLHPCTSCEEVLVSQSHDYWVDEWDD